MVLLPGVGMRILDQTALPGAERWLDLTTVDAVCEAIATLRVRGAPLLGVTAAGAMAIAALEMGASDDALRRACRQVAGTRPTAVELSSLAEAALALALAAPEAERPTLLWRFAEAALRRRSEEDTLLAEHGATLFAAGSHVLTHCNTGALATGGRGTALAVIQRAWELDRVAHCFACETRPLLQGARLTMWELARAGVPSTLLADSAAASLIGSGRISAVITGADRITRNGDTANKVGTLGLAIIAARFGTPFYIAAPLSTFDPALPNGSGIPIELRSAAEVTEFRGIATAPPGANAYNPAFDVTPAALIAGIVTEAGVLRPPFGRAIRDALTRA